VGENWSLVTAGVPEGPSDNTLYSSSITLLFVRYCVLSLSRDLPPGYNDLAPVQSNEESEPT
jgi:hypothetical protein